MEKHVQNWLMSSVLLAVCFLCYHHKSMQQLRSLAKISSHMVLIHRLQLMPIVFDMRWLLDSRCGRGTYPEHPRGIFSRLFWFWYFPLIWCLSGLVQSEGYWNYLCDEFETSLSLVHMLLSSEIPCIDKMEPMSLSVCLFLSVCCCLTMVPAPLADVWTPVGARGSTRRAVNEGLWQIERLSKQWDTS